ncbi:MAG: ABC transporter ATP-binding protein, partial [Tumebacillaceae bacterium]
AQAIMEKPHVLLLDEPTNGLDQSGIELFSTLLQEQIDRGAAVLLVSHQKDDINRYCDHVYKMEDGALTLSAEQRANKWLAVLEDMSELERMYQLEPSMQLTERVDGHPTCIVQGPWKNGDELKSYMQVNGIAVREIKEWSA